MKLIDSIDIQPQNVKWLYDLNEKELLGVDKSFQRNYVWTKKNQIQLIESLVIGYPIPEIYIWNTGTNEETGDTQYSIVDGQQRTGAIFQYISNRFKLNENHLDQNKPCFERVKNRFFKDLETEDKKAIWSYIFSVRLIRESVSRQDIVNMFLRLNSNNMTLNPQELRKAEFDGEFMKASASLAEHDFWSDNKLFGIADRRRMNDVSFVSTLLVFMKKGIDEDIRNNNLNAVYDLYNDEYLDKEKDTKRFIEILQIINEIISGNEERIKILRRQVHFYTLFTVLYELTLDGNEVNEEAIVNYRNFIDNFENDIVLKNHFEPLMSMIYQYRSLAKEGTRDKGNRLQRHEIIRTLVNYKK
ncbi:TPA: DUF262 domain-containing protein [Aeromonas veronii]|nr:DUF262 domain-containing protein [Aeromonas veronii]